jgi:hypothetical protein
MLFREIITVHSENHTKPISTMCGQIVELLIVKVGGTYGYHWALNCKSHAHLTLNSLRGLFINHAYEEKLSRSEDFTSSLKFLDSRTAPDEFLSLWILAFLFPPSIRCKSDCSQRKEKCGDCTAEMSGRSQVSYFSQIRTAGLYRWIKPCSRSMETEVVRSLAQLLDKYF